MKLWSNNTVPRGAGGFNPERRLLAAVLQRAITDYLTGEGELQETAREWLYGSDDVNEAFGFAFICEALDFHKEELRKAIRRQYDRQYTSSANTSSANTSSANTSSASTSPAEASPKSDDAYSYETPAMNSIAA